MSASEAEPLFCAAESASRSYAVDEMSDAISIKEVNFGQKYPKALFSYIWPDWLKILKLCCDRLKDGKSASELD